MENAKMDNREKGIEMLVRGCAMIMSANGMLLRDSEITELSKTIHDNVCNIMDITERLIKTIEDSVTNEESIKK